MIPISYPYNVFPYSLLRTQKSVQIEFRLEALTVTWVVVKIMVLFWIFFLCTAPNT